MYEHNSILSGVSKVATTGSETVQVKLDRNIFSFDRDVVVSFSYCSPANSSFTQRMQVDSYEDLEQKLSSVGQDIDLICLGDFNSRTGPGLD